MTTDPLGVRRSCRAVVASSAYVQIDPEAVRSLASEIAGSTAIPEWDAALHYRATGEDADERTAMWILVLDALNFCFWGQGPDPSQRWRVRWQGELVDGYVALVAALRKAVDGGYPLHDAEWLRDIAADDVARILEPEYGHMEIPLFDDRMAHLRELGAGLAQLGQNPASTLIRSAGGSAAELVRTVVRMFPSFNDVTLWPYGETGLRGNQVRFYKRAQILVGDLAGGLAGSDLVRFQDREALTAFADYKVPQMLRELGVLRYETNLADKIDARIRLAPGSREEIEIRASTIVACDLLVEALAGLGTNIHASQLDWLLWSRSQELGGGARPYHLTTTVFY